MKRVRGLLLVLGLAAVSFGAAGCNEYHYYDVRLRYDGAMFTPNEISQVQTCHVFVSGADTKDFYLEGACTDGLGKTDVGIFEFSTFADSGTLNFTIKTYVGFELDNCLFGTGMKSYPATSATTQTDDGSSTADDLIINVKSTPNCNN